MRKSGYFLLLFVGFTNSKSFEPYELNGGLISAVAGDDYCILGSDTRKIGPGGYLLSSRNYLSSRMWSVDGDKVTDVIESSLRSGSISDDKLTTVCWKKHDIDTFGEPTLVGASGCAADCEALKRSFRVDMKKCMQLGQINASPGPDQVASLLSQTLYSRRSFPFYSFCCVAGIDGVFVFDAIGSYEQVAVASAGTGRASLQPILDRTFRSSPTDRCRVDCTLDEAISGLVLAYRSVSEREIGVGDKLVLQVLERFGNTVQSRVCVFPLKFH